MRVTVGQINNWLREPEGEHLEFKEARQRFDFEELVRYCVALANEEGGHVLLGVSDKRPRRVVGSAAFTNLARTRAGLAERLPLRIEVDEASHPDGRVVVVSVPSRPIGMAIQYKGAYWMRVGDAVRPMTPDRLATIFAEAAPDYSAEVCPGATLDDLNADAVEQFRARWRKKSRNDALATARVPQLLEDAELLVDGKVTYAALVLLGTRKALGRCLGQAEVIFEYRSSDASIPSQQRKEYREGFLLFHDDLWEMINLRNDLYSYQDGLFRWDVRTFNEDAVREAILNAVGHREYRLPGSVFLRQWPKRIEIVSPGGLPWGITVENILWRQNPRNRRLTEAFARCGLVERSGQGADRMFESCVREGKLPPDFSGTDEHQVSLTLHGQIQDPFFLRFLEQLGAETQVSFDTRDLVALDAIYRERSVPEPVRDRLSALQGMGAIEKVGRKHILARRFYFMSGRKGVYTRKRGLDRETNKTLLIRHIEGNRATGTRFEELMQVLPALSRNQIWVLLRELRGNGMIFVRGKTRSARWFPGSGPNSRGRQ